MQAIPSAMSKNSFIVSFVVMGLLYHGFASRQQIFVIVTNCYILVPEFTNPHKKQKYSCASRIRNKSRLGRLVD